MKQTRSTYPYILSIENNIAVVYAIQKIFDAAERKLCNCLKEKRQYYKMERKDWDSTAISDRVQQLMEHRPTITETEYNLAVIKRYVCNSDRPFNPYEFILQY